MLSLSGLWRAERVLGAEWGLAPLHGKKSSEHDLVKYAGLCAGHRAGAGAGSWQVRELYVKWRGRAYAHCAWVPEAAVLAAARRAAGQQLLRRLKAFRLHQDDSVRPWKPQGLRFRLCSCCGGSMAALGMLCARPLFDNKWSWC